MNKAVFLDRDGVIVEDVGYHYKTEDFKLMPNAVKGLKLLKNYKLFIATNQSGVGRGYYKLKDFEDFNNHLVKELKQYNIKIRKTYCCPHRPQDNCECRKPKTKMLEDAKKEFDINLRKSFAIGDRKSDFEMGKKAGCKTIHVLGKGEKTRKSVKPDYFAKDLLDAARWILKND